MLKDDFINPADHFKMIKPPIKPISGSKNTKPKYLPNSRATIAVTEVKASAKICRYAALKFRFSLWW